MGLFHESLCRTIASIGGQRFCCAMPVLVKLQRAEIRAIILRSMVEIFRTYYQAYFKTENFGVNVELGFILFAVAIGQAEDRLMSATDISNYLGMSRATVSRKLKQLLKIRAMCAKRDGKRVCYFIDSPNSPEFLRAVDKVIGIIQRQNSQLLKMVDASVDHKSDKH